MTDFFTLKCLYNPKKRSWLLCSLFFVLSLTCGSWLLWGYSFAIYPDGVSYVQYGKGLFDFSVPLNSTPGYYYTTLPYKLMHAITNSAANPFPLIWLQIIIGALAVAVIVYVISCKDVTLAIGVGLVLATDLLWGTQNRIILTEGPFTSFHVLALACLLYHYDHRSSVGAWKLFLAGVFYGWTFLFRPANMLLVIFIPPIYLCLTRSWRKMAWVSS